MFDLEVKIQNALLKYDFWYKICELTRLSGHLHDKRTIGLFFIAALSELVHSAIS